MPPAVDPGCASTRRPSIAATSMTPWPAARKAAAAAPLATSTTSWPYSSSPAGGEASSATSARGAAAPPPSARAHLRRWRVAAMAYDCMMIASMASGDIKKKTLHHELRRGHRPGREPLDVPRELVERLLVDGLELQRGREGLLRLVAALRLRFL